MSALTVHKLTTTTANTTRGDALAGTDTLIKHILRRERIRIPSWLVGFVLLLLVSLGGVSQMTDTEETRQDLFRFMDGAAGAIFGPGYGRYDITAERYVVGVYGMFFFILVALMSMKLVARN